MFFTLVTTDKRVAGKAAWVIFVFCTLMETAMALFGSWPLWAPVALLTHIVVMSFLTFFPKCSPRLQSIAMMLLSFGNIFLATIAENEFYSATFVFLGIAIILSVYLSEKLLFAYSLLSLGALLYHAFILKTIPLGSSMQITQFVVRTAILCVPLFFLMVFISKMNKNRERMEESVDKAQRTEQYKSDFLANMSHEIRTPMNAIIGMCELVLREEGLSNSVRENCFNIQASGRSLLSIINDILDYSKIDSGKMEIVKEEFNIASVLNDILNMSEARRGSKPIKILVNVDPEIPAGLLGDEVRIRQIVLNLMTNAIKFTEKGSITLSVTRSVQEYGINLVVAVKDSGIGITEENMEKLFTSFRQVDTKKNRAVEGTGLGLAISKNLVHQMGGYISAKSKYGVGSEFRFAIPLQVSDERPFVSVKNPETVHALACFEGNAYAEEEGQIFRQMGRRMGVDFRYIDTVTELKETCKAEKPFHIFVCSEQFEQDRAFFEQAVKDMQVFVIQNRAETTALPDGVQRVYSPFYVIAVVSALNHENVVLNLNERRSADVHFFAPKARVLVVDDNVINLKVAVGLMQPYNMQVLTATSGPEAISMLQSRDFDIVFMDHMMPKMDGVEATAILRSKEDEYFKNLPIIALTANVANGAREMFLCSGFNDFLAKPIELSTMDRVLRNHLPKEYMEAPSRTGYEGGNTIGSRPQNVDTSLLDYERGISYMGGNEESYREILALYVQTGAEKLPLIEKLFQEKDVKNYTIEVHALKSTSMGIGAIELYSLAKDLETAGKAGNLGDAEAELHAKVMKLYAAVMEEARNYLGGDVAASEQPDEVDRTALKAIFAGLLKAYLAEALDACHGFDGDALEKIAEETAGASFDDEPLKMYFGKAAKLAGDFEYDAAENELLKLRQKLDA